mgnify:CR=1 FL=1
MNRNLRKQVLVFLFILWTSLNIQLLRASEQTLSPYSEAIKAFEEFVVNQMALERVPGLSVGFMKGDFVWAKGFGYSDLENMVPAKAESSYRLASVTKTITAIAVLQLVEAGKINLDATIQTYVPYFPRKRWPVTIRQLLGHLGGISHYKNDTVEGHIKEPKNTKQALAIFEDFDLVAEPGTRYSYSSYGFNLLGAAIEGASGESYGNYIKKHIFDPLGMENSRLDNPLDLIPNRVKGYMIINNVIKNSEYVDISSRFAGGGTRSTVIDLLKYCKGIISGKILKKETIHTMFSSMVQKNGYSTWYGMGWVVRPWRAHFQVNHGGSQPETRTHLLIFPTDNFSIAIASNLEGTNLMAYVKRLAELVLDEDMDSAAYASNMIRQAIYEACDQAYSFGMSFYDWHQKQLAEADKDLEEAFSYFNKYVNEKELESGFEKTRKKIQSGTHPASKEAFIKVGSFMTSALKEALGEEKLGTYRQSGPIAFFSDYIRISEANPGQKMPRFEKDFIELVSGWEKDWNATYTDYIRRLFITPSTNFNDLETKLRETSSGRSIYADFSTDLASASYVFLEKPEPEKAFRILNLSLDLYPNSPVPHASLASAYLWTGATETARNLYKEAYALDHSHPVISIDQLFGFGGALVRAKKIKEAIALGNIVIELYPKDPRVYTTIGDFHLQTGQKDKAFEYYRKALGISPDFELAKTRLREIQKKAN